MQRFLRIILTLLVLAAAAAMVVHGARLKRNILDADAEQFGDEFFSSVSDKTLVRDATFSGVKRKDGKLYTTYDRNSPQQGKQACPT